MHSVFGLLCLGKCVEALVLPMSQLGVEMLYLVAAISLELGKGASQYPVVPLDPLGFSTLLQL